MRVFLGQFGDLPDLLADTIAHVQVGYFVELCAEVTIVSCQFERHFNAFVDKSPNSPSIVKTEEVSYHVGCTSFRNSHSGFGDMMSPENKLNSREEPDVLEELTSDGEGSGLEAEKAEKEEGVIRAPFDPEKIDVITQSRTVDLLLTRLREGELDLSPEFQRRANVWDEERKSSLIESMLLRIPIPSLYVSEDKDGNYTVVDGLQRLCAISHFVEVAALNRAARVKLAPLRLKRLESLAEYNGDTFDEIPRALQRRIKETELTLHIIRASTPPNVKFNIFSRINRGGLPLTAQEIRNAIYAGDWRPRIRQLAEGNLFTKATEGKIKRERMQDIELVLRFVAHYTLPAEEKRGDEQNLDDFLNDTVEKRSATWSSDRWRETELAFGRALEAAPEVFGRIAFRKYSGPNEHRRPINRGLFESECVCLARRSEAQLAILADRTDRVIDTFKKHYETDADFSNALLYATGRGRSSNKRFDTINLILDTVLHA
jgi:hypothetical protein